MNESRLAGLLGRLARGAGTGTLAGLVAGLVCGVCGRMVMRAVALAAGQPPRWSTLASLELLLVTSAYGAVLGLLYVAVRRWLPGRDLRRGALFGTVVLALLAYPAILAELHVVASGLGSGPSVLGATLIGSLFILNGVVLELAVSTLRRERWRAEVAT